MKKQLNLFTSLRGDEDLQESVAPPKRKPVTLADLKTARNLRGLANSMQSEIDEKFASLSAESAPPTARRLRLKEKMQSDYDNLRSIQKALRALAEALESGEIPLILSRLSTRAVIEQLFYGQTLPAHRLIEADILPTKFNLAREALLKLIADFPDKVDPEQQKLLELRRLEQWIALANIPGYIPTPPKGVELVLEKLDLRPGLKVLEPSAGAGHIAQALVKVSCDVDCVEINPDLCALLRLKGFTNIFEQDFLTFTGSYERIAMNPDFTNCQDAEHIRHAYVNCLTSGGILAAIASEGLFFRTTRTEQQFRDWLSWLGDKAKTYELPKDLFKSSDRPTGVATRLVVLRK